MAKLCILNFVIRTNFIKRSLCRFERVKRKDIVTYCIHYIPIQRHVFVYTSSTHMYVCESYVFLLSTGFFSIRNATFETHVCVCICVCMAAANKTKKVKANRKPDNEEREWERKWDWEWTHKNELMNGTKRRNIWTFLLDSILFKREKEEGEKRERYERRYESRMKKPHDEQTYVTWPSLLFICVYWKKLLFCFVLQYTGCFAAFFRYSFDVYGIILFSLRFKSV